MMPAPITTTSTFSGRTSSEVTGSTAGPMAEGDSFRVKRERRDNRCRPATATPCSAAPMSDQAAEHTQRMMRDRNRDDEEIDRDRQHPEADPEGSRTPFTKGHHPEDDIDDEQQDLHGQPTLDEGVLLNDDGQEQRGRSEERRVGNGRM